MNETNLEKEENKANVTLAQFIMGKNEIPEYVKLNHNQFKLVMSHYQDSDLIVNDNFENVLVVTLEDGSELRHILSENDN